MPSHTKKERVKRVTPRFPPPFEGGPGRPALPIGKTVGGVFARVAKRLPTKKAAPEKEPGRLLGGPPPGRELTEEGKGLFFGGFGGSAAMDPVTGLRRPIGTSVFRRKRR